MKKVKFVQMKKMEKGKNKGKAIFMAGQTVHPVDNPDDYKIQVGAKNVELFIVVGERGIYILTPELVRKMAEKLWRKYLETYRTSPRRGSRTKGKMAKHPNAIDEDTVREVLKEEGYSPCDCRFIDLVPDKPKDEEEAKEILNEIEQIISKAKSVAGVQ